MSSKCMLGNSQYVFRQHSVGLFTAQCYHNLKFEMKFCYPLRDKPHPKADRFRFCQQYHWWTDNVKCMLPSWFHVDFGNMFASSVYHVQILCIKAIYIWIAYIEHHVRGVDPGGGGGRVNIAFCPPPPPIISSTWKINNM